MKQIISKLFSCVAMVFILATAFGGTIYGQTQTLVSGSGTSGYAIPSGWTSSGTVEGGSYLKFDNGTITSPEFAPLSGLSFAYSVATFGSGTNHPLTIRILNASTNEVIKEATTDTPTSSTYISTGSPLSLGNVTVAFKIQLYAPTGKGIRLRNYSITATQGTPIETVATPTLSPAAGTYTSVQNVTISTTTQGATIYYTTDGSNPTTNSSVYSTAITVNKSTTIKAMAVKEGMNNSAVASASYVINLPYSGAGYVRVNSLDYLTDGSKVILAARYNTTANAYYAMTAVTAGKPTGVSFSSTTTSVGEEIPSSLLNNESSYYWTVSVTQNGYTFTNSDNAVLGYTSGTSFATGGDNTNWVISRKTSGSSAMVAGYEGFCITNKNVSGRGIALNNQHNYGPYATSNNDSSDYNFYIDVFVEGATPVAVPSIAADNVSLGYDATSGSIAFTIANPVDGGVVTATSSASWLTIGTVSSNAVALSFAANDAVTDRSSIVTLTYTYNTNQTVTKEVTVTQAGNPNILDEISDITEENVDYTIKGTIVAKSAKALVFGDGTGYVYYFNTNLDQSAYNIGDVKKVSGTSGSYNHVLQFTSTATIEAASNSSYDNTPAVQILDADAIGEYNVGLHLSDYVQIEGRLVKSTSGNNTYYNLQVSDLTTDASIAYPTSAQAEALDALLNKTVTVKGYFAGVSGGHFNVAMESVEEVVVTTPSITVSPATVNHAASDEEGTLDIVYENFTVDSMDEFDIEFYDAVGGTPITAPDWIVALVAEQDPSVGDGYVVSYLMEPNTGEARSAYFRVFADDDNDVAVYSNFVTITQAKLVIDYATLPFSWAGGTKSQLVALNGVSGHGLGSDYAESNAPYRVKFDDDGDYILIKTDQEPGVVSFAIKKFSAGVSTISIQGSSDGETFTLIQEFATEGEQNGICEFTTTAAFDANDRYVRIYFNEPSSGGTNVGVGPISISTVPAPSTLTATLGDGVYWATFFDATADYTLSEGAKAFTMNASNELYQLGEGDVIPAGVAVVILSDVPTVTLTVAENVGTITPTDGNILQGSNSPVSVAVGTPYVLGIVGGQLGFYEFTGASIPAFKAYYVVNNND